MKPWFWIPTFAIEMRALMFTFATVSQNILNSHAPQSVAPCEILARDKRDTFPEKNTFSALYLSLKSSPVKVGLVPYSQFGIEREGVDINDHKK